MIARAAGTVLPEQLPRHIINGYHTIALCSQALTAQAQSAYHRPPIWWIMTCTNKNGTAAYCVIYLCIVLSTHGEFLKQVSASMQVELLLNGRGIAPW